MDGKIFLPPGRRTGTVEPPFPVPVEVIIGEEEECFRGSLYWYRIKGAGGFAGTNPRIRRHVLDRFRLREGCNMQACGSAAGKKELTCRDVVSIAGIF